MGRTVTVEQARSKLLDAVSKFDWTGNFMRDPDGFSAKYVAFSAQLRRGHRLAVEVRKKTVDGRVGEVGHPNFCIVLYRGKGQEGEVVYEDNCNVSVNLAYHEAGLLYEG